MGPVLFVMALISTVESELVYRVQLACFGAVAAASVVAGVAHAVGASWAGRVLVVLSWLGFAYFAGSGGLMAGYGVRAVLSEGDPGSWLVFVVAVGVAAFGLPFLLIALKLRRAL